MCVTGSSSARVDDPPWDTTGPSQCWQSMEFARYEQVGRGFLGRGGGEMPQGLVKQ